MEKDTTVRIDNKIESGSNTESISNIEIVGNTESGNNIGIIENTENLSIGQIDYAILKSMYYGIKKISDMKDILEIRKIIIEKHVYILSKELFIRFQNNYLVLADKGNDAIDLFERDQPFELWGKIDEFLIYSLKRKKEQKIRFFKMIDNVLAVLVISLIIYILFSLPSIL